MIPEERELRNITRLSTGQLWITLETFCTVLILFFLIVLIICNIVIRERIRSILWGTHADHRLGPARKLHVLACVQRSQSVLRVRLL